MSFGFTRIQAELALSLGWPQEELLDFHKRTQFNGETIAQVYNWGFVTGNGCIHYRGTHWLVTEQRRRTLDPDAGIIIYGDGSGTTGDKAAGIGVYVDNGRNRQFISENIGKGSNNRAELIALWRGLRQFPHTDYEIVLRTDSEYAIGSVSKNWHANVHADLIRRIRQDLNHRHKITFEHVDGHSGIQGNEIADSLAKIGRKLVTDVTPYEDII